jgi:hypothetical protein
MKKLAFTVTVAAAAALGACSSSNQDQVNNAELNQPGAELNDLSTNAANDAASEAAALGNQQAQLNSENAAADDNATNPTDAQEQNVSGM